MAGLRSDSMGVCRKCGHDNVYHKDSSRAREGPRGKGCQNCAKCIFFGPKTKEEKVAVWKM